MPGRLPENETLVADLGAVNTQLQSEKASNVSLTSNLKSTTEQLNDQTGENNTLTADLQAKTAENETLTADLQAETAENERLTADLDTTTERLTSKIAENETLTADLNATTEQLTSKIAENEALTSDLNTKTQQLVDKTSEHEALVKELGDMEDVKSERDSLLSQVESLNSQISRLRSEISSLEQLRRPLIVRSYNEGFLCTGSMEPKITCLDSATWLVNFNPEDIIVDTVIIFDPPAECDMGSGNVAHRVKAIRTASNTYFYWPKGDANAEADGCWIPHTNVLGYMIDLHKNVHPENADLRNRVNTAKAVMDVALSNYEYAVAVHDQKQDQYDSLRLRYCGSLTGSCQLPTKQYNELIALENELISGLEELLRLLNIYLATVIAYELVYYEALTS